MNAAIAEEERQPGPNHLLYPPGGLLVWALVVMELLTFGVALIAFQVSGEHESEVFQSSRSHLSTWMGLTNTIFLLTSGYLMALSLGAFKKGNLQTARRFLNFTMLGGFLFLALKGIEYHQKISQGDVLGADTFFAYYWLLTVFHLMHVVVGLIILMVLRAKMSTLKADDFEAGAVFWHMCDLIWLLLFPALYLVS